MFTVVPEVSLVSSNDKEATLFAFGFYPDRNVNVDSKLPAAKETFYGTFGKPFTKGNSAAKVQLFFHTTTEHDSLLDDIMKYKLPDTLLMYQQMFNIPLENDKLVIKVSPIKTYRDMMTCFKEAMMTQRIYSTERNGVRGADLVCKPYICCPMDLRWRGWSFVTVTAFAEGIPCRKLLSLFHRLIHKVSMKELYLDLSTACDKLWKLGFVHNDLHPGNVMYSSKSRQVTFIDLETAVELPSNVIGEYINARDSVAEDCHITFNRIILTPALHLLRHSERWLNEFTIKEVGYCRGIYNVDGSLLEIIKP